MLAAAGASINSMPSSEVYTGLQTGVLDAVNTSSGSFVSYRIYEQVECLTPPGEFALWFMYEPILMSKESFESLTPEQQQALLDAGQKAEDYFFEAAQGLDRGAGRDLRAGGRHRRGHEPGPVQRLARSSPGAPRTISSPRRCRAAMR